jgi:dipeptidyl aminopeptidase/acylaminoacyl peptidase
MVPSAGWASRRIVSVPQESRPDGRRFVVETLDNDGSTIWVGDFDSGHALWRLTFGGHDRFPLWSPDGKFVVFQAGRDPGGAMYRLRVDGLGSPELLATSGPGSSQEREAWSPDGGTLLFRVERGPRYTLWAYSFGERRAALIGGIESNIRRTRRSHQTANGWRTSLAKEDKFCCSCSDFLLVYFRGNATFVRVHITFDPVFSAGVPVDLWPNAPQHARMQGPPPHRGTTR